MAARGYELRFSVVVNSIVDLVTRIANISDIGVVRVSNFASGNVR